MKIYRITAMRNQGHEHDGYIYYSSKKIAEREQAKNNEETEDHDTVVEIEFDLTKQGILSMLNIHASYPDNG